jgi:hypothetical protein
MSDDQKNTGGSPCGAGKSLAVMQQRLLSKSSVEESKEGSATAGAPAGGNASGQPAAAAAQGRPKGKDFAAMAMNAKAPAPAAPAPQPVAPNRPKGKDLAAMANRMPSPVVAPTGTVHPQDPARAAKMQAAARAAAGLPPLAQPTATSVTTVPPPITASVPAPRPAQPAPAPVVPQATYQRPPQQAVPVPNPAAVNKNGPTPMAVDARQHAAPRAVQDTSRSTSGSYAAVRRNSGSIQQVAAPVAAPAPAPKPKPKVPARATPQPSPAESRLSFTRTTIGGAHMSPLVGQRLRDLVASLDPNYVLDAEAEEQVLQLADDFLDKVTRQSLRLAQHRGSRVLDVQDVQLALKKQWGIVVPGLGPPTLEPPKPANRASASAGGTKRSRASSAESGRSGGSKKSKPTASSAAATPKS